MYFPSMEVMTEVARCISPPPLIPVFPVVGTSEAAPLSMLPTNVKISSTFIKKKHLEPVVVVLVYCLSFTQLRFYHSKATYSIWQSSLIIRGINAIQLLNLTANSSFLKGMTKIMTAKKQCGCLCLCYDVCKIRLLGTATNVTLLNGLIVAICW